MKLFFSPNARPLGPAFCLLACLGSVACGSDEPTTDETNESSTKRDAGSSTGSTKRDAGSARDAGKTKDAKVEESEDEAESEDEEDSAEDQAEDESDDVTEPPAKDASAGAKPDAGKPASTDAGAGAPTETASCAELTYATFGEMFLKTYCYECHSSKVGMPLGGIVLDSRAGITKSMSILKKMVVPRADGKEPAMPKGGNDALTDAERTKFGQWIDCGAK